MNLEEKTLKQKYEYKGKIINLRVDEALLPNNETAKREVIEHPGGVAVIAEDENGNILFVKQFRYPYGEVIYEIPAGKRDKNGEDPLLCGKRELKEETGAVAQNFYPLGELYPTPGYCGEIIWLFAANKLSFKEQELDSDEFLSVEKVPLQKAIDMVLSGEIKDAKTQIAILKYAKLRKKILK